MIRFTILFLLLTGFAINTLSQKVPGESEYEMAEDLFKAEKYTAWVSILEMSVAKDYPKAILRKGDAYYLGLGVDQNYLEALKWYKKAAELNNVDALYLIGILYKDSLIEGKSYKDAIAYYKVLNEKGYVATNMLIGEAYLNGDGVNKDIISAKAWFKKGMEESDGGCIFNMGCMYQNGISVKKNLNKAVELMGQACDEDYLRACEYLGDLYFNGEEVEKDMPKSANWFFKGMELNGAKSHFYYAKHILLYTVEASKEDALSHTKKAKELGYDPVLCDFLKLQISAEMHE